MLEVIYSSAVEYLFALCRFLTTCIDQPLLKFWSHPEQSWMFALIAAAIDNLYCFAALYYIKFERYCKLCVMFILLFFL